MILALFILVAAFFAVYTLLPFWEKRFRRVRLDFAGAEKENLVGRKSAVLEAIRDLEYDYKMQKVTDDDYHRLKEKLTNEAVDIMKKLDHLDDAKPSAKRS
jgi:hypothetical protein